MTDIEYMKIGRRVSSSLRYKFLEIYRDAWNRIAASSESIPKRFYISIDSDEIAYIVGWISESGRHLHACNVKHEEYLMLFAAPFGVPFSWFTENERKFVISAFFSNESESGGEIMRRQDEAKRIAESVARRGSVSQGSGTDAFRSIVYVHTRIVL